MQRQRLIDAIWAVKAIRNLYKGEYQEFLNDVVLHFPSAVEQIITAYDFAFALDVSTTTTTANEDDYVLYGANQDCRDVINVKYGTGLTTDKLLERIPFLEQDRRLSGSDSETSESTEKEVATYSVFGRVDGFPQIRLNGIPSEAGKIITYRYRKNNIDIDNLPDEFSYVAEDIVKGKILPEFIPAGQISLMGMIHRYSSGGDEYTKMRLDPVIWNGNRRRSGMGNSA